MELALGFDYVLKGLPQCEAGWRDLMGASHEALEHALGGLWRLEAY